MIRYTVLWRQDVEGELATFWSASPNRQKITAAADRIDEELRIDADQKGIGLREGLKSLTCLPLTAYFHVDEADRKVFVEAIRLSED